ncbi:hypothetical protein [Prescottella subtropica]|uniref:hypothetical protein n=1 Tax=Prescottella subtropica TaxID=2545757 RepID=UPI0010F61814|nr:hypothetical protein [Prescottella subtropica]
MAQTRRTGVFLHTGNPISKARTPFTGGRDVKGSGVWDSDGKRESGPKPPKAKAGKGSVKKPKPRAVCAWCGNAAKKPPQGTKARCGRCKRLDEVIAAAARYIGANGLRPLGASLDSDSAGEARHREAAAAAQRTLNSVRKVPSGQQTDPHHPKASPPPVKSAASPAPTKVVKKRKPKKAKTPHLPEPDHNDLEAINRKLAELHIRVEAQQRHGAADTGAGRARLGKLQAHRRRLATRAAALRAERGRLN